MGIRFFILPRTVVVLGGVALLNDTASDMLTPLLPLFVTRCSAPGRRRSG